MKVPHASGSPTKWRERKDRNQIKKKGFRDRAFGLNDPNPDSREIAAVQTREAWRQERKAGGEGDKLFCNRRMHVAGGGGGGGKTTRHGGGSAVRLGLEYALLLARPPGGSNERGLGGTRKCKMY